MATKKKPAAKRPPARKSAKKPVRKTVRRKPTAAPPPPTIAGVFQLISTKRGFLDQLLTDMNVALTAAHLDLPPAERETLQTMLTATYHVTGAEVLHIFDTWRSLKVAPPPPPWSLTPRSQTAGPTLTPVASNERFRDRWRDTLAGWPQPIARAFTSHLDSVRVKGGSIGSLPPYWVALATAFGRSRRLHTRTVDDMLWATTCLAHALRIEDDLLDGDAAIDVAIFAPAMLYVEADHLFSRYFAHRSKFWKTYHRLIRSTIEGIALASEAQRSPGNSPRTLARLYIRECDLFTIPLAALCHLSRTLSALPQLVTAAEHLAVVGQAIDDLVDIEPDLQAGRVNLAALYLLGNRRTPGTSHADLRQHVAQNLLFSDRLRRFFSFLHRHLAGAREVAAALHLSGADRYIFTYRSSLLSWEEALQGERNASVVRLLQSR